MVKLLVTGSRSIVDDAFVDAVLNNLGIDVTELVHGGAIGVDTAAGRWAVRKGIPVHIRRPDFKTWPIHRLRWKAYTPRDIEMVDEADQVVAIWNGHSRGTRLTYQYAEKCSKLHRLVLY